MDQTPDSAMARLELARSDSDKGYGEAKEMLLDLISRKQISDTAIRVARDHMVQFARKYHLSARLDALTTDREAAVRREGWQDISTAPRDGTPFLAYNPLVGVYNTAFTLRWTGEPDEEDYEGFPCGFWHTGGRSYPFGRWDCAPTHWMPLPEPPAAPSQPIASVKEG